jgi:CheY-like chemotaxis protein
VILLDIGLPDFKGYNIARQLKWEPDLRNTRIIAITGRSMDEVRQKALEAGCEEVFAKPMDLTRLEEILVKHEGGKDARTAQREECASYWWRTTKTRSRPRRQSCALRSTRS